MANVNEHRSRLRYSKIWKKCRDVEEGEDSLHDADLAAYGTYLMPINPTDTSEENNAKNDANIKMARFQNYTGVTLSGYMGLVFRMNPKKPRWPETIKYIEADVDGAGTDLDQQARKCIFDALLVGGCGTLVEGPPKAKPGALSKKDVRNGARASIKFYAREDIIDWSPDNPTAKDPLNFVKLREHFNEIVNGKKEVLERHIVLVLKDGVYHQDIYQQEKKGGEFVFKRSVDIVDSKGGKFNHIPFEFGNAVENSPEPDKPVMLDMVNTNLGMYQEDANLRYSSFQYSSGTLVIADESYQRSLKNNSKVKLGVGNLLALGNGGRAEILVPPPNPLAMDIKKADREDLVGQGARVIIPNGQAETEETTKAKMGAATSQLTLVVQNISDMYNKQFKNLVKFMGGEIKDDELYQINREFFDKKLSSDEMRSLVETWHAGLISKREAQTQLQQGGRIDHETDLEKMNEEIDFQQPAGLELDQE